MELLGPGISDSMEIKTRYYGMHWDIVGYNDGIYDKMADMFMAISCGPKICFSGLVGPVENFRNPRHPRQFDIPLRVKIASSGGCICRSTNVGGAGRGTRVWLLSRVVSTTFSHVRRGTSYHWFLRISWGFMMFYGYRKKVGHISNCKLIVIGFIFPYFTMASFKYGMEMLRQDEAARSTHFGIFRDSLGDLHQKPGIKH
jgi:hypothetical protein